jgi:hypothetical protein
VTDETILVDASWDHNSCAGLPYTLYSHEGQLEWSARYVRMLPNAFMAEAMAMLITMKEWSHRTISGGRVTVYTDCCSLVEAIRGGDIL